MTRTSTTYRIAGQGGGPTVAELEDFIALLPVEVDRAKTYVTIHIDKGAGQLDRGGWDLSVTA